MKLLLYSSRFRHSASSFLVTAADDENQLVLRKTFLGDVGILELLHFV